MNDPLDYENPRTRSEPPTLPEPIQKPPALPTAAVPVEFDTKLTESTDQAGVNAVEAAMKAAKIAVFRTDDGKVAGRTVTLYVRAADHERAAQLAGGIFARRARVRKVNPPPEKPADGIGWTDPTAIDIIL